MMSHMHRQRFKHLINPSGHGSAKKVSLASCLDLMPSVLTGPVIALTGLLGHSRQDRVCSIHFARWRGCQLGNRYADKDH